jgi:hypothetical protein
MERQLCGSMAGQLRLWLGLQAAQKRPTPQIKTKKAASMEAAFFIFAQAQTLG